MNTTRRPSSDAVLVSLENAAITARAGFACMFSTADEFENALISERRAQGRYRRQPNRWPVAMFVSCALVIAGAVLLLN